MSTMLAGRPGRRPRTIAAALPLLAILAACAPAGSTAAPSVVLSIVGTNDLHGGITSRDGRGGLALLGGYVNNLRAARANDGAVLLIDAGDMFQGTLESNLSEGAVVIAGYNTLGYTAAAVGNHEFDFGPAGPAVMPREPGDDARGALKARATEARFPLLAANLVDAETKRPVEWPNVKPSVMVDAAGLKVGIIGVMTLRALSATLSANTKGLAVVPLAPAIAAEAKSLRAQGAALVVVTAHAGGRCKTFDSPTDLSSCEAGSEILAVARELPTGAVDVIVAGHSHAGMAHMASGVAIIESFSGGRTFGRVDVTIDRASKRITDKRVFPPHDLCERVNPSTSRCADADAGEANSAPAEYEGRAVEPDEEVAAVLTPAIDRVRDVKAETLGVVLDTPIRIGNDPESPLGNLFTNVLLQAVPGADIAVNNTFGGVRADLPAGQLTYGQLFEAYPFDNQIVRFNVTGADLKRIIADRLRQSRDLPGIAGVQVRAQCSGRDLRISLRRANGSQVSDGDRVSVVTTDFLAQGGDGIFGAVTPPRGLEIEETGLLVRDVSAEWLRRRGGRLRESDLVNRGSPRWQLPGPMPVRCR